MDLIKKMKVNELQHGDYITNPTTPLCYSRYIVDKVYNDEFLGLCIQIMPDNLNDGWVIITKENGYFDENENLLIPIWRNGFQINDLCKENES